MLSVHTTGVRSTSRSTDNRCPSVTGNVHAAPPLTSGTRREREEEMTAVESSSVVSYGSERCLADRAHVGRAALLADMRVELLGEGFHHPEERHRRHLA